MKRLITLLLVFVMLVAMFPVSANAETVTVGMRKLAEGESYKNMTSSQMIVDIIKDFEGFRATPYADKSQWSIGYGSYCGDINGPKPKLTWTRAQAEAHLRDDLKRKFEPTVNSYCKSIGRQPSQQQFDALVDLTYNCGGSWTTGTAVTKFLKNPTNELAVVRGFGAYCRNGGDYSYVHMNRRIREALIFVYGEYYLCYGNQDCRSNLRVVSNDKLPHFKAVVFKTDRGSFDNDRSKTVEYYMKDEYFGYFPQPTRSGYTCVGWKVTKRNNKSVSNGEEVNIYSKPSDNLELTAIWKKGTFKVEPPEKPVEHNLPFTDVPKDSWFYDSVVYVYNNDYMDGVSKTKFNPAGDLSRGMMMTLLYRLEGSPKVTDAQRKCFKDIAGLYCEDAIAWAYANGIANGVTETEFKPDRTLTRQEAVTFYYRYCVEYRLMPVRSGLNLNGFADKDSVLGFARESFAWAVDVGLVNGVRMGDKMYLDPMYTLNRATAAVLLERCAEELLK